MHSIIVVLQYVFLNLQTSARFPLYAECIPVNAYAEAKETSEEDDAESSYPSFRMRTDNTCIDVYGLVKKDRRQIPKQKRSHLCVIYESYYCHLWAHFPTNC